MTPTLITAKNGKARPKNPYPEFVTGFANDKYRNYEFDNFESTVQWHDCPGCEDGEYLGELVTQYWNDGYQEWTSTNSTGRPLKEQQIWRIVPQPQEVKNMKKPILGVSENNPPIPNEAHDGTCFVSQKEEAKTAEGKTAEEIEQIASKVHDAWWEEKKSNGFHSPNDCQSKNKESYSKSSWQNQDRFDGHFESKTYKWCEKCHPDMYPYSELTENAKEYDRTTVTTVIKAMQAYSSQQIKALVEENERLREALENIRDFDALHLVKVKKIAIEALKPKQ